jgi:putative ABC transport system permease protein
MFALVTGKTSLEVTGKGGGGAVFSEALLDKVKAVPGVKAAAPVVDRPGSMSYGDGQRVRLRILGVDPQLDPLVRDYTFVAGRQVETGYELALDEGLAKNLGLAVNGTVKLLGSGRLGGSKEFTIVGLFRIQSGAALAQLGMGLIPIDTAQAVLNSRYIPKDSIDRIQIVSQGEPEQVQPGIAAILPADVEVHRPAGSTQLMSDTLRSSEQGLELTTIFMLLMAAFIILNTFLMNVSERRRHISIMRAIGATRSQIMLSLLGEAFVLGLIGTIVGCGTGLGLAYVGTQVIAQAFEVQLPRLVEVMTPRPFIVGAIFGMLMAFIGAVLPAWLAGRVSPLEGMNRLVRQPSRNFNWLFAIVGTVLVLGAAYVTYNCITGAFPIEGASYAAPPLLIGLVMLDTVLLGPQVALAGWFLRLFSRVEATLAQKQILRNRMRSALTVAVLFIAGSTGVGIANSILDNVRNVHEWQQRALVADFFVRAMMPDMATGLTPDLPEEIGAELRQVQGIKPPEGTNLFEAKVVLAGQEEPLTAIGLSREFTDTKLNFDLISGDLQKIPTQISAGEVVIGSVLSQKTNLTAGDKLPLQTRSGVRQVPIAGVANDYLVGGMSIYMQKKYAEEWLDAHGVDGFVVNALPGQFAAVKPKLEEVAKKYGVIVISQNDIKEAINRFVGGTEWSLWLLVMMGFVVAAFGMVNTLTMNVLEQTRELGLLRIVAMTKAQIRRTIIMQALIIGCIGLPPGVAIGVGIAYVLNLTMMPSFGHLVRFHTYPGLLLATLVGGIVIVVIAAWFPARRATRINVVEALHYE